MHQCTEFPQYRSHGFELSRFFVQFSKWGLSAVFDLFGEYLDCPRRILGGLDCDRRSIFDNMKVSIFGGAFGLKTPIHTLKLRF